MDATFESTDWFQPENSTRVIETFKSYIDNGQSMISLIHDNIQSNCDVLPVIIPYAIQNGYTFVDPLTCLEQSQNYQGDNTYGPLLTTGI